MLFEDLASTLSYHHAELAQVHLCAVRLRMKEMGASEDVLETVWPLRANSCLPSPKPHIISPNWPAIDDAIRLLEDSYLGKDEEIVALAQYLTERLGGGASDEEFMNA